MGLIHSIANGAVVPDSLIPILPVPCLSLHMTDPRAEPTLRWEPEPRGFVSIEELFQALFTLLQVVFNFLSAYGK